MEGAVVRAQVRGVSVATMTDDDGRYALTLPDGQFRLHAWDEDYQPAGRSIAVDGRDRIVDLHIRANHRRA